jgi:hypothetical protein
MEHGDTLLVAQTGGWIALRLWPLGTPHMKVLHGCSANWTSSRFSPNSCCGRRGITFMLCS